MTANTSRTSENPYLQDLDRVYNEILRRLDSDNLGTHNMMIAGGAVRDALVGNDPKDYDVFVTGGPLRFGRIARLFNDTSTGFLLNFMNSVKNGFSPDYGVGQMVPNDRLRNIKGRGRILLATIHEKKYFKRDYIQPANLFHFGRPVQMVCYNYTESLPELIDEFDLDISMYGYNPEMGLITGSKSPTISDLQKKMRGAIPVEVNASAVHDPELTEARLRRFRRRFGCDITSALDTIENSDFTNELDCFFVYQPAEPPVPTDDDLDDFYDLLSL